MEHTLPLFDQEFALKQLSGNKQLLFTLLEKFKGEYAHTETSLALPSDQEDASHFSAAVHTLKGISGNLGMSVLHQACKDLERATAEKQDVDNAYQTLCTGIHATLEQVTAFIQADAPEEKATPVITLEVAQKNRQALITALQSNEYISPQSLAEKLPELGLDARREGQLQKAINDLDYSQALELLGES